MFRLFWKSTCNILCIYPTPFHTPTGHPFLDVSSHISGLYIVRQGNNPAPYKFLSIWTVHSLVKLPDPSKLHSDDDEYYILLPICYKLHGTKCLDVAGYRNYFKSTWKRNENWLTPEILKWTHYLDNESSVHQSAVLTLIHNHRESLFRWIRSNSHITWSSSLTLSKRAHNDKNCVHVIKFICYLIFKYTFIVYFMKCEEQ